MRGLEKRVSNAQFSSPDYPQHRWRYAHEQREREVRNEVDPDGGMMARYESVVVVMAELSEAVSKKREELKVTAR